MIKYKVALQPNKQPVIWRTRENITVASDTHVIQASEKLGIISSEEAGQGNVQELAEKRWQEILKGTELVPIDVHTPMWLWSRGKFSVEI